jgi:hypothetical protein
MKKLMNLFKFEIWKFNCKEWHKTCTEVLKEVPNNDILEKIFYFKANEIMLNKIQMFKTL